MLRDPVDIDAAQDRIIAEMAALGDWMDRYTWLIAQGASLAPMAPERRTEQSAIPGCQAQVWLVAELPAGRLRFEGDADARITRGILSLVLSVVQDRTPEELLAAELYFVRETGLASHLSPSRANGLASILARIRSLAEAFSG